MGLNRKEGQVRLDRSPVKEARDLIKETKAPLFSGATDSPTLSSLGFGEGVRDFDMIAW